MKKTLCTLVIAGCAAALAPAGAAAAKPATKPKAAQFLVQVSGTQAVTWREPRKYGSRDCEGQQWDEGSGQETITFRTKQKRISIPARGKAPTLKLGGNGSVNRTGARITGLDPDPRCFDGGPTQKDTGPYDCREETLDYNVDVDWTQTVGVYANPRQGYPPQFTNCPLVVPHPVLPARFTPVRSEPFSAKKLLGAKKGKVTDVAGSADFREAYDYHTTEAKVRWTIRFKRVK